MLIFQINNKFIDIKCQYKFDILPKHFKQVTHATLIKELE